MKTNKILGFLVVLVLLMAAIPVQIVQAADLCVAPGGAGGCYATIQAAITASTTGDTIHVAAGTYNEQVTINKAITVTGEDGAVIDGTGLIPTWTTGVKIKSANVTFNNIDVTNFTQDGIIVGYEASPPGSLQNVHITNSKISNIQPGYWGFGIYVGYEAEAFKYSPPKLTAHLDYSGLLIEGNEIENTHSSSLVLQSITGTPGTLVVRNNYIHDGDNDGIWIDSARNIIVEDNVVQNNADGFYISSYGDAFVDPLAWEYDWSNQQLNGPYGPQNISITGNIIVDNNTYGGIYLAAGYPSTIYINENSIAGNIPGVANYLSEPVDASANWWGNNTPEGVAANLVGSVDYTPWLDSGTDTDSGLPGFQGDFATLWVDDDSPQIGSVGRIQEGVNLVSGITIYVAAGTYAENLVINKALEMIGAGVDITIIQPAISAPNPCNNSSMCGGLASNIILVQANDVVIHDLTVDGDNPTLTSGIVRGDADLDARNGIIKNTDAIYNNLEVYNITARNIYLRGVYSTGGSFNFHDNTVTNVQGDSGSIAMFAFGGTGIMANNYVSYANDGISANWSEGIQFFDNTITNSGSGVHTDNSGYYPGSVADLIQGNSVDCSGTPYAYGVWTFVPYMAPTIDSNIVVNCDIGLSAWGQGAAVITQFTNNTVTGNFAEESVGAYITTDWIYWGYSDISVNFSGNIITGYETGVYLTADQQAWNPKPYEAKTVNATFHLNSIAGNTYGADMGVAGTYVADFEHNWWGSNLADDIQMIVNNSFDFDPWLCSGTDTSPDPGFQPILDTACAGPITSTIVAASNPTPVNGPIILTANVDDAANGGSIIASAEYSLEGAPWLPMSSQDDTFDEVSEDVMVTLTAPLASGIYDLCVRGTDTGGATGPAECILLVVYDPSAGFVTGGGWIDSPVNTNYPYMLVGGKATFGFVSKYKKGADVPEGNTEFQFKAGNLNFHSTSYEWLVVAGDKAQFKGVGTINGQGEYKFMISAEDGSPDTFRIKIWTEVDGAENVIYDNGVQQALGGGSIVIHK